MNRPWGHLRAPRADEISGYASRLGWTLSEEETGLYADAVTAAVADLDEIEALPETSVPLKYTRRDPGRRPTPDEDPCNAVIQLCEVPGAPDGPLAGKTLAVKDCIAVAGVPMTNGGRRQPVLVPTEDAVVIERLLDAGATVIAKTNMEDLGYGQGEGSAYGPTLNPLDPTRSSGGSSSGSGAAVASGLADLAIGADEGGSVRIPAAWCGLVGMKATHGLVPSYGMTYLNHTLDHIGPMTKTVADNALMLEAMAGPDWRDPQWTRDLPSGPFRYADAGDDIQGLRIGIVIDALGPVGATADVIAAFEGAARTLKLLGATVSTVSVPLWSKGQSISMATTAAAAQVMVSSGGAGGYGHLGRVDPHATAVAAAQARLGGDDLPPMLKTCLLVAEHVNGHYSGSPFVKAHNLRLDLRRQIDAQFADVDVLITPTTPGVAHTLLTGRTDAATMIRGRGTTATRNTCPTDLTGHPSITVPCGTGEAGMPVGLQIIGPRYAERLLYQVAFAFEGA